MKLGPLSDFEVAPTLDWVDSRERDELAPLVESLEQDMRFHGIGAGLPVRSP